MFKRQIVLALCSAGFVTQTWAYEPPVAMRESSGSGPRTPLSCRLSDAVNGTCGNYKWFNICSGYIWVYSGWSAGEGVGVLFGGPEQPCVSLAGCDQPAVLKRVILYFRNVRVGYNAIRVSISTDDNADGCPDYTFTPSIVYVGERWNCWELGGCGAPERMIIQQTQVANDGPSFATDGPNSEACAPIGAPRSFYYGVNGSVCQPWVGPTGRRDNFLTWLIYDTTGFPTTTENSSWGRIKGLFR